MATSRHLEKVLAHAEDQLAVAGKQRPTEVLSTYKKFLKLEEHRLRLKHLAGGGGRDICARRCELVDVILRHVFTAAANAVGQPTTSLALIALGGYGRGELNPFSDVDVMLLHCDGAGKVSPYVEGMAEQGGPVAVGRGVLVGVLGSPPHLVRFSGRELAGAPPEAFVGGPP